jgi:hypothetical protein
MEMVFIIFPEFLDAIVRWVGRRIPDGIAREWRMTRAISKQAKDDCVTFQFAMVWRRRVRRGGFRASSITHQPSRDSPAVRDGLRISRPASATDDRIAPSKRSDALCKPFIYWEARIHRTLKKFCLRLVCALALTNGASGQDAVPFSRTNRSIIPTQDQPAMEPGGFKKEDHITGDWDGYRERLFASGVEVFGYYNSS